MRSPTIPGLAALSVLALAVVALVMFPTTDPAPVSACTERDCPSATATPTPAPKPIPASMSTVDCYAALVASQQGRQPGYAPGCAAHDVAIGGNGDASTNPVFTQGQDCRITRSDAHQILRYVIGLDAIPPGVDADLNDSGTVTAQDAQLLDLVRYFYGTPSQDVYGSVLYVC